MKTRLSILFIGLVVAIAFFFMLSPDPIEAGDCDTDCPAGQKDPVTGCCIKAKPKAKPKAKTQSKPQGCPNGMEITVDTAGHCCWPGQVWVDGKCIGEPTKCPDNFDKMGDTCKKRDCPDGMKRQRDGVHCCWPGQGWSSSRKECLGTPSSCPDGLIKTKKTCGSPPWTDPSSGLTWQGTPPEDEMNWADAKAYCSNLELGGYSDWRLPTLSELRSLIRGCSKTERGGSCGVTDSCLSLASCYNDACHRCEIGKGPGTYGCNMPKEVKGDCSAYWSSSAVADRDNGAWYVHFYLGHVGRSYVDLDSYVRCVR